MNNPTHRLRLLLLASLLCASAAQLAAQRLKTAATPSLARRALLEQRAQAQPGGGNSRGAAAQAGKPVVTKVPQSAMSRGSAPQDASCLSITNFDVEVNYNEKEYGKQVMTIIPRFTISNAQKETIGVSVVFYNSSNSFAGRKDVYINPPYDKTTYNAGGTQFSLKVLASDINGTGTFSYRVSFSYYSGGSYRTFFEGPWASITKN